MLAASSSSFSSRYRHMPASGIFRVCKRKSRTNRVTVVLEIPYVEISAATFRLVTLCSRVISYAARTVRTIPHAEINPNGTTRAERFSRLVSNTNLAETALAVSLAYTHTHTHTDVQSHFVSLRNLFRTYIQRYESPECVANVSGKFAEQAVLRAASRGNFVLGQ